MAARFRMVRCRSARGTYYESFPGRVIFSSTPCIISFGLRHCRSLLPGTVMSADPVTNGPPEDSSEPVLRTLSPLLRNLAGSVRGWLDTKHRYPLSTISRATLEGHGGGPEPAGRSARSGPASAGHHAHGRDRRREIDAAQRPGRRRHRPGLLRPADHQGPGRLFPRIGESGPPRPRPCRNAGWPSTIARRCAKKSSSIPPTSTATTSRTARSCSACCRSPTSFFMSDRRRSITTSSAGTCSCSSGAAGLSRS